MGSRATLVQRTNSSCHAVVALALQSLCCTRGASEKAKAAIFFPCLRNVAFVNFVSFLRDIIIYHEEFFMQNSLPENLTKYFVAL